MGFLDELKMGYASVAAPQLYHTQMLREKDKQASLVSAMIARQAPDIMAPIMGKPLNDTHAAMLETLKRAMMSNDPELQHEAYKMLSNNQDRVFSAINPTDLVKNVREFESMVKATGGSVEPGVLTDIMLEAIVKPQTQINMGDKPAPIEYINNYRHPVTHEPMPVQPGATLKDLKEQGGVILNPDPVPKQTLKTPPAEAMTAYTANKKNMELTKRLLESLNPDSKEYKSYDDALGAKNILGELPLGTELLDHIYPEQTNPKARVASVSMQQIYDALGKAITAVEDRLGRPIIPKVTNSADAVRERLAAKLDVYKEANQSIEEAYPTTHGYFPFNSDETPIKGLPAASSSDKPGLTAAQPNHGRIVAEVMYNGKRWVKYEDGHKEQVDAK